MRTKRTGQAASGDTAQASGKLPEGARLWWGAALFLSLLPALVAGLNLRADEWRVCQDIAPNVGEKPVVEACRPPAAADYLVLLLPIGVLLFPNVAEIAIPGLISVKRKIAQQEEQQKRLEQDVVRIQQQVTQNVANYIGIDFDTFARKAARFIREDPQDE